MTVAGGEAEQVLNSRRCGRGLGDVANLIVGTAEAGAESQKFGQRTINLRRTATIVPAETDASGRLRETKPGGIW